MTNKNHNAERKELEGYLSCLTDRERFSNGGGYTFADTYIEYLELTYGWSKVLEFIETEKYEQVFEKSSEEIYDEWVLYLNNYYQFIFHTQRPNFGH